ncbi:hypothetical protein BDV97DRAFT_232096 [Delphinella strobiligena]|nr:hypothetical protein BDV97DRAFT_232096 [Delphinella strobiligena]
MRKKNVKLWYIEACELGHKHAHPNFASSCCLSSTSTCRSLPDRGFHRGRALGCVIAGSVMRPGRRELPSKTPLSSSFMLVYRQHMSLRRSQALKVEGHSTTFARVMSQVSWVSSLVSADNDATIMHPVHEYSINFRYQSSCASSSLYYELAILLEPRSI